MVVGGGQSGLAAARAGSEHGWEPVILEAGPEPVGSWPAYYDSLRLFSPSEFSGFPGYRFPGPAGHYPTRDEVVGFLRGYAGWLGVDIRTGSRVVDVAAGDGTFTATLADGELVAGDAMVAATGSFANGYLPTIAGSQEFGGQVLHVAAYRSPEVFAGQRVVVVGAGNSAVQVGYELAQVAETSLAVRERIRFMPQVRAGRDVHFWLHTLGVDRLPPSVLSRIVHGTPVLDTGTYRDALACGALDQRRMFTAFTDDGVTWPDGTRERVDAVIFATGYRPHLPYLESLDALDGTGMPRHRRGVSTTHPALGYLGLELQRSLSSNTLRGVHRDAGHVLRSMAVQSRRVSVG